MGNAVSGNRRRRVVAVLSSLGVMASLAAVVVATKAAVPQRGEPPIAFLSEAADTATAMAAAQRQKSPVTVTELTTESRLVKAHPDGSLQAELSITPMRVQKGQNWAEIDTTLVSTSD